MLGNCLQKSINLKDFPFMSVITILMPIENQII